MTSVRHFLVGLRAIAVLTVVLGLGYPLLVTLVAQLALPWQANGSIVGADGREASVLIAQDFSGDEWLQPRPSAALTDDEQSAWNPMASGGTNLGPNSEELASQIAERRRQVADLNGARPDEVPADALTASSSGLDPDISPANAALQVDRIAHARGVDRALVEQAIAGARHARMLGFLGEERINVVEANLALSRLG